MNERIKSLLNAPQFERLQDWTNIGLVQRATLEEFAELIVQECARQVFNTDLEDVDGGDKSVLFAASTQLRQYFGVK